MRYSISNTAEYGDMTRGPRVITDQTRAEMKQILDDVQSGKFANEWMDENKSGAHKLKAMRDQGSKHQIEEVGEKLRSMMSWIASNKLVDRQENQGVDIAKALFFSVLLANLCCCLGSIKA